MHGVTLRIALAVILLALAFPTSSFGQAATLGGSSGESSRTDRSHGRRLLLPAPPRCSGSHSSLSIRNGAEGGHRPSAPA